MSSPDSDPPAPPHPKRSILDIRARRPTDFSQMDPLQCNEWTIEQCVHFLGDDAPQSFPAPLPNVICRSLRLRNLCSQRIISKLLEDQQSFLDEAATMREELQYYRDTIEAAYADQATAWNHSNQISANLSLRIRDLEGHVCELHARRAELAVAAIRSLKRRAEEE
jgi:hypothetical protein